MRENEIRFFRALSEAVGADHLRSKCLGTKVSSRDVFLDRNIEEYSFPSDVIHLLVELQKILRCTGSPGVGSLAHHIDGFFDDHPLYGTRIVEFDEEQHFSTCRIVALKILSKLWKDDYLPQYNEQYGRIECFNRMLQKHRLKTSVDFVPGTIDDFFELVRAHAKPNNGSVKAKIGFDFIGGRVAQRAYYDSLRDIAHLSPKNSRLKRPFRCSMFELEAEAGMRFVSISQSDLQGMIQDRLAMLC